jgi:hypothetical protein
MPETRRSFAYQTHQIFAVIAAPAAAAGPARALTAAGFAPADVTLLRGAESADRLDGLGEIGGPWRRIVRGFQYMTMDQMPDFRTYEAAIRDGRAVVAVQVTDRPRMLAARDALIAAGGHFINYFGRLSTEEFTRWQGPELPLPDYLALSPSADPAEIQLAAERRPAGDGRAVRCGARVSGGSHGSAAAHGQPRALAGRGGGGGRRRLPARRSRRGRRRQTTGVDPPASPEPPLVAGLEPGEATGAAVAVAAADPPAARAHRPAPIPRDRRGRRSGRRARVRRDEGEVAEGRHDGEERRREARRRRLERLPRAVDELLGGGVGDRARPRITTLTRAEAGADTGVPFWSAIRIRRRSRRCGRRRASPRRRSAGSTGRAWPRPARA